MVIKKQKSLTVNFILILIYGLHDTSYTGMTNLFLFGIYA